MSCLAAWLMKQAEVLLQVMMFTCLLQCSNKDYSCLAHEADRGSLVCHVDLLVLRSSSKDNSCLGNGASRSASAGQC